MSGHKETDYHLDAEQELRSALLLSVGAGMRGIQGNSQQLSALAQEARMVRAVDLSSHLAAVADWQQRANQLLSQSWSMGASSSALSAADSSCHAVLADGRGLLDRLSLDMRRIRERREAARQTLARLTDVAQARTGYIDRWTSDGATGRIASRLEEAARFVSADDLSATEQRLQQAETELTQAIERAQSQEAESIRQAHLREHRRACDALATQQATVRALLTSASEGLKAAFRDEVAPADDWLSRHASGIEQVRDDDVPAIECATARVRTAVEEGRVHHARAEEALTRRAAALKTEHATALDELARRLEADQELLRRWCGDDEADRLQSALANLYLALEEERLLDLRGPQAALDATLAGRLQHSAVQEARQEKRLYMLEALKSVCAKMGMSFPAPEYQRDGDLTSPIVLSVNTHDRGEVSFYLSLDRQQVTADACITGEHCFEEFDQLTERLRERFGVHTRFTMPDGSRPERRTRGEKDEPFGGAAAAGGSAPA